MRMCLVRVIFSMLTGVSVIQLAPSEGYGPEKRTLSVLYGKATLWNIVDHVAMPADGSHSFGQ